MKSSNHLNLSSLTNPVMNESFNLRDPSVYVVDDGYVIFYSRFSKEDWRDPMGWSIDAVHTKDFRTFSPSRQISPYGFASPGDCITWHGKIILPYQSYPTHPARLCYSVLEEPSQNTNGISRYENWSKPIFFLEEALTLPWNKEGRLIDPTFLVDGDTLHCWFIGTAYHQGIQCNLMGHAFTKDPGLASWQITTKEEPLFGVTHRSFDGVENACVIRSKGKWIMIYSEGLRNQHLAAAESDDLLKWNDLGIINIPTQNWNRKKFGAPFVWTENDIRDSRSQEVDHKKFNMILMGTDENDHTTFGLLHSRDGLLWEMLKTEFD